MQGRQCSGYAAYHSDGEIAAHFKAITSRDVVEALALEAIRDVRSRRWQKFLKRVSKAKGVPGVPPKLT